MCLKELVDGLRIIEEKTMIEIKKSPTADTRTCDWNKADKETLENSSISHINDVQKGIEFFQKMLRDAGQSHDFDKLSEIEWFLRDFKTGFKETGWWDNHRKVNRHHVLQEDGIRDDVNLVDIIEFIVDCVMAGMARSGSVYDLEIKPELLVKAFENTVKLLKQNVKVVE